MKWPTIEIEITSDFVSKRVGLNITKQQIIETLSKLGFKVADMGQALKVIVPSYRATKDVSLKEDLVEEIARSYGYDNIKPQPISMEVKSSAINEAHNNEYQTKYLLAEKYGLNEVHSYLWNYSEFNNKIGIETNSYIGLVDSSNAGQSAIRSELTPTLIKFMEENRNSFDDIKIFEIGKVCTGLTEENLAVENKRLSIVLASQSKSNEELYFALKEIMLDIAKNIYGTTVEIGKIESLANYMHPVNSTNVFAGNKNIGSFGLLHPSVKLAVDKRFNMACLEIELDELLNATKNEIKFKKVSKFQDVNIDYSFQVPAGTTYAQIENHLKEFRCKLIWTYKLVDVYHNENMGDIESWTIKFNICSLDKTLSANDIDTFNFRILQHMEKIGLKIKQ